MMFAASSNSWAFDRCVTSPVWTTNAGRFGIARICSIADCSVDCGEGFGSLLKPMWLSLICTKLRPPGVAAAAAALIVSLDSQILAIFARSGNADELLTGTGRSFIWELSWSLVQRAPVFGYGFNSTYAIFMEEAYLLAGDVGIYVFPHSHNLFLQLLLYGGVIALALFAVMTVSIMRSAVVARDPRIAALLACYLSFTMTEPGGFFQYADNMMALLVVALVAAQLSPQPMNHARALRQPVEVRG